MRVFCPHSASGSSWLSAPFGQPTKGVKATCNQREGVLSFMMVFELLSGPRLAEGKTKIILAVPDKPDLAFMYHKDAITAGDGARRDVIEGKGELSCRTTSAI